MAEKCLALYNKQLEHIKRNLEMVKKFATAEKNVDHTPLHHPILTKSREYNTDPFNQLYKKQRLFLKTSVTSIFFTAISTILLTRLKPKGGAFFLCCSSLITSLGFLFSSLRLLPDLLKKSTEYSQQIGHWATANALLGFCSPDAIDLSLDCVAPPQRFKTNSSDLKNTLSVLTLESLKNLQLDILPKFITDYPNQPFSSTLNEKKATVKENSPLYLVLHTTPATIAELYNANKNPDSARINPEENQAIQESNKLRKRCTNYYTDHYSARSWHACSFGYCTSGTPCSWLYTVDPFRRKEIYPNPKPFLLPEPEKNNS